MSSQQRATVYLVYRLGDDPEQVVLWDTLDITVGRLESRDIIIPDAEVSREHAVFKRAGDRHLVEDLGSALGTTVNGERITRAELNHGDEIQIGTLALRFGTTQRTVKAGGNVRWASELKGFAVASEGDGRTMLGFDVEEDAFPPTVPALEPELAKAVSMDGTLEELDELAPLAPADAPDELTSPTEVRNLDGELAGALPCHAEPAEDAASVVLELEVKGPRDRLNALLAALLDNRIQVPPFEIRLRRRQPR